LLLRSPDTFNASAIAFPTYFESIYHHREPVGITPVFLIDIIICGGKEIMRKVWGLLVYSGSACVSHTETLFIPLKAKKLEDCVRRSLKNRSLNFPTASLQTLFSGKIRYRKGADKPYQKVSTPCWEKIYCPVP